MTIRSRAGHSERGDTLLEILISVTILGTSFVAILAGLGTAINLSSQGRGVANAQVVAVSAADIVKNQTYVACATVAGGSYVPTTGLTLPSGWTTANVKVTTIKYLNGTAWATTCPATDQNVELVTVTATSPDGRGVESVDLVKRKAS
ncbi:MAG: hypothetical protein JWL73_3369 [Actinomycetia bacterium]|nr:hypothetical protein [Actinomycetes bacterium]